jgi:hypothetical protein
MAFFDFASTIAETKETHQKMQLRTRYYKTRYEKMKNQVLDYCKITDLFVKHEDDVHGELFLQANGYHMIVSIVQVSPMECAVDIKVQTYGLIGLFKPMKIIAKCYAYLDKKVEFKGVGLRP